jgi:hypothetical protein
LNSEDNFLNNRTFSPDGSWLASMHNTNPTMLWNVASPHSTVVGRQKPPYTTVAFTPGGRLVSTSDEGVVRVWPLSPAAEDGVREIWSRPGALVGCSLDIDARGRFAFVCERFAGKVLIIPLDGSPASVHQLKAGPSGAPHAFGAILDPAGQRLAVSYTDMGNPAAASSPGPRDRASALTPMPRVRTAARRKGEPAKVGRFSCGCPTGAWSRTATRASESGTSRRPPAPRCGPAS